MSKGEHNVYSDWLQESTVDIETGSIDSAVDIAAVYGMENWI
jgi:hypothetical protein